ncbi:MAG: ABC transporter substrate-binding protein [Alkaliphilus sp.]|nr:MAG: ABC transporter substrate-binding protein [Alkaliphilus sp.]
MKIFRRTKIMQILLLLILMISVIALTACGGGNDGENAEKPTIVFGDAGWDSFTFHNEVARMIVEKGYGYPTEVTMGSSAMTFTALRQGDIDVYMETWIENFGDAFTDAADSGEVVRLSSTFPDSEQGLYVLTFVIEGDKERGIEPMAPTLKSVKDLPRYWEIFKDEEDPTKGRLYGAIPGWVADEDLRTKFKTYGLDETFNYFSPGSDAGLASSIVGAYERGEAWVGYYWNPTWIMGKYDMTLLTEEPFSEIKWENGRASAWPPVDVAVVVHKDFLQKAPDVVEFLKKYTTTSELTSQALSFMEQNNVDPKEAAIWFLKEHEDIWTEWVPAEVAEKVKAEL